MNVKCRNILVFVIVSALANMGCATGYVPRETGQIHFVRSWKGDDFIEKGGKEYPFGHASFSGKVVDAFSDNPAAEAHARTYVRRQQTAGALAIVSGLTTALGFVALLASANTSGRADNQAGHGTRAIGLSVTFAGLLVGVVAAVVSASGDPYLLDAVNLYNDDALKK